MDAGTIVTLLPDGGWKYLSSGAWTDDLDVVEERAHAHQLLVTRRRRDRAGRRRSLRGGGLVAFPTETVYGLGADAANRDALRAPLRGEGPTGRPPGDRAPRATPTQLDDWAADVSPAARALAAAFWPGPLTLVVARARRACSTR